MSITTGSRIGVYEVTSQLGEGGMGVVFRARDTRLLRDVAIKLLPDHFADDPDRLARLEREAQVLASLNHPNIAQIYGIEQVGNIGCIVMELVAGETLNDRLKNGPFPLDEALEIAKQIAEALAAAHERGIVHRDLKPANIKLTPSGKVKVLDFGLAKALDSREPEAELSNSPTKVTGSTLGAVVGTPAYMSPEQARGREVDSRTDIWAFGCVLFEMLTARQTFEAETTTDMIAKIVTAQPDLDLLPAGTPSSIRLLLDATLNKNVHQRLQHIGDMRLFLDEKFFPPRAAGVAAQPKGNRGKLWIGALALILLVVLAASPFYFRSAPAANASAMQFELALPGIVGFPVVSPDGQRIAYLAQPADDSRAIWMRSIGSEAVQKVPRTDNALAAMFWSPDSRYLAFVVDGRLKKLDVASGSVQVICDATGPLRGFSWNREGVILLSKDNVIGRVSDQGGTFQPITKLDAGRKEQFHGGSVFLPDGHHFLYVVISSEPENAGIFVGSLESGPPARLMPLPGLVSGMAYSSGYLLISGGTLMAQAFDPNRLTLAGQSILVAEGLEGGFSISDTGLLFYRKAATAPPTKQLIWFDHSGRQVGQVGTSANYGNVDLSPTGDRVAVDINTSGNRDVWVIDIARAVPSRITFEPGGDWSASWSPDGSKLVFASTRAGAGTHIYQKSSSGVGTEELLVKTDKSEIPVFWSHDGRHVVFSRPRPGGNQVYDTWILDMSAERTISPFVESPFDKLHARISPDGRWIAYATNDSGIYQIVVQSFPDPNGGKWQITAQGGMEPKWRHDGRELYYLAYDGKLMAVPVKGERTFETGTPVALFESPVAVPRNLSTRDRRYDVAADGRFLFAVPTGNNAPAPSITIVNWASALTKK